MTDPTTTATDTTPVAKPAATVTPRKTPTASKSTPAAPKPAARKAPAKKAAPAKPEFAPKLTDKGRLDHTDCAHPRDPKGRAACRAEYAKSAK